MSSEPGNESFFCALRPIPRILRLQDDITRVKLQVASCAACESIWQPLRLSTNRLRPVATPVGTPEHFRIGSFSFADNGMYRCFSCNATGCGAIDLMMALHSVNITTGGELLTTLDVSELPAMLKK